MKLRILLVGVIVLIVALAPTVQAQTPARDPTTLQFTASLDHNSILEDGRPALGGYVLWLYYQPDPISQPWAIYDLGKPTPDADGQIVLPNHASWFVAAQKETPCVARVEAYGPLAENYSEPSNVWVSSGPPVAVASISLVIRGGV